MKSIATKLALILLSGALLFPVAARAQEHILATGDTVEVKVFGEPDLETKTSLSKEGKASLPLVKEVPLAGLSTSEAARVIEQAYKKGYLVNPKVTVTVAEYARQRFSVSGAVNKPGTYLMPPGEKISIQQAIGMAGGFNRLANPKKVMVSRGGALSGRKAVVVNVKELAEGAGGEPFVIQPNDVIEVKESAF